MSREERITCNQCGAVKKETNHWYSAIARPITADVSAHGIFLLGPPGSISSVAQDICGHQCAIAALNQFLQTGSLQTGKIEKPKSIEEKA